MKEGDIVESLVSMKGFLKEGGVYIIKQKFLQMVGVETDSGLQIEKAFHESYFKYYQGEKH